MKRALLLLLLVLPVTACGGTTTSSLGPLALAAAKTASVGGAHVQLDASIRALGEKVPVTGTGEIGDNGRRLHLRLSLPLAATPLEAVVADGTFYARGGPLQSLARGKWIRVKTDNSNFNLGQADPTKLLEYLRSNASVEERGTATIRGVQTTHYVAHVKSKQAGARTVPVDVWVDGQGLVRRLQVAVKESAVSMDFFDFGNVNVDVPASSDTVDLSNMLGGG